MAQNIGSLVNSATTYAERAKASRVVSSWMEETSAQLQALTTRLLSEVTALHGKEHTINANPKLSTNGKFDQVKAEVQAFVNSLQWLRLEKGALETKIGNVFGDLFVLPASTRKDQPMRDHEIRSLVQPLPPDERSNLYLQASQDDNTEVLRALQDAPMALIANEVVMRGSDQRAARLQPKRYQLFVESGELLNEVSAILDDALSIGEAFGVDVPPSADKLGVKIRTGLDFGISHLGGRGKHVLQEAARAVD